MTHLPPGWHAPWMETDGGAAELQTDVMRFMAILALCLVAIFALVQAIPPETPATPEPPVAVAPVTASTDPTTEATPEKTVAYPAANPRPAPADAGTSIPVPPQVVTRSESHVPAAPSPSVQGADAGFTLRFASDNALKSLVARSDVGLYAMQGEQAKRLHVGQGGLEFWTASMPAAFHEMDAATVPGEVMTALSRIDNGRTAVRWGVTLPPRLSQEIDRQLATGGQGDLVISATGTLRLE